MVHVHQLALAGFQDDYLGIALGVERLVKQDAFELGVDGPVAMLLVEILHVIQAGLDGIHAYAWELAAEVHHAQGLTFGQSVPYLGGGKDSLVLLLQVVLLALQDAVLLGYAVAFQGQALDLLLRRQYSLGEQFVVRHFPGDYLLLAQDVGAVLTDGRQDHSCYPVLEGAGVGFVGAHDQLVEAGFGDKGDAGGGAAYQGSAIFDDRPQCGLLEY